MEELIAELLTVFWAGVTGFSLIAAGICLVALRRASRHDIREAERYAHRARRRLRRARRDYKRERARALRQRRDAARRYEHAMRVFDRPLTRWEA